MGLTVHENYTQGTVDGKMSGLVQALTLVR